MAKSNLNNFINRNRGPLWAAFFFALLQGNAEGASQQVNDKSVVIETLMQAEGLLAIDQSDPQLHFVRGMALAELGRYLEAADEFRWMLTHDPSLLRPRLELGRIQVLIGQHDSARYTFEQVLANDLPVEVRQNILAILARIREQTTVFTMSFAFVSDSNPNQATTADEIEVAGVRYRVSSNGKASKSTGARLAFEGRVPLEESSLWFIKANGEFNQYSNERLNFQYLQAALGRNFHLENQTLAFELGGHASTYGNDPLYQGAVFSASDFHQLRQDITLKLVSTAQQLNYHAFSYLSGWQFGAALQGSYSPSSVSRWEMAVGLLRNVAAESPYSFLQYNISGRYMHEWVGGWISGFGLSGGSYSYDQADPVFLEKRRDTETKAEFELSNRRIRLWKFTPQLQIGRIERHSNIDLYNYKRTYARIGMTGDF